MTPASLFLLPLPRKLIISYLTVPQEILLQAHLITVCHCWWNEY